jgi:phage tail tube protein FII
VDQIVEQVINKAAEYGYEIECTYTAYEIDGQITEIDPLRVVNRR